MLMPVEKKRGLKSVDVFCESIETEVGTLVSFMNSSRRIMRDEDIHFRHVRHQVEHVFLLKKMESTWLVPPATTKAPECGSPADLDHSVQVHDGFRKGLAAVVVSLHRVNPPRTHFLGDLKYCYIRQISQRDQQVDLTWIDQIRNLIII